MRLECVLLCPGWGSLCKDPGIRSSSRNEVFLVGELDTSGIECLKVNLLRHTRAVPEVRGLLL